MSDVKVIIICLFLAFLWVKRDELKEKFLKPEEVKTKKDEKVKPGNPQGSPQGNPQGSPNPQQTTQIQVQQPQTPAQCTTQNCPIQPSYSAPAVRQKQPVLKTYRVGRKLYQYYVYE